MITIVTSRTYLLCESINSITLQFAPDRLHNNQRYIPYYDIFIDFVPQSKNTGNNGRNSDESNVLTVRVCGEKTALHVYKEIVTQIRDQLPDEMYLDKMLEKILDGSKDINDEHSPIEISGAREKKADVKKYLEELAEAVRNVAAEVGVNGYFQDPAGTVYKIVEPEGKFVYFEKLSYVRTKRGDEKRADLSVKEAQEAGYTVPS